MPVSRSVGQSLSSSVWLGLCSIAIQSVWDRSEHCHKRLLSPTSTQLLSDVWCVPHGGQQQVWSTVQCIQVLQAWRSSECSCLCTRFLPWRITSDVWGWTRRPSRCKVVRQSVWNDLVGRDFLWPLSWGWDGLLRLSKLGDETDYSVSPSLGMRRVTLSLQVGMRRVTPSLQAWGWDRLLRLSKLGELILSSSMNCTDPEEQVAVRGNVSGYCTRCGPEDLGRRMIFISRWFPRLPSVRWGPRWMEW